MGLEMLKTDNKKIIILGTIIFAAFVYLYVITESKSLPVNEQLLWIFGLVYYLLLSFFFFRKQIVFLISSMNTRKWIVVFSSLLITAAVVCMPFFRYNTFLQANRKISAMSNAKSITVRSLNKQSDNSQGTAVIITEVDADANSVDLSSLKLQTDWKYQDNYLVTWKSNEPLTIPLNGNEKISISFAENNYSGYAEVTFLGNTKEYNLYSSSSGTLKINLSDYFTPVIATRPLIVRLSYYGMMLVLFWFPITSVIVALARKEEYL